MNYKCLTALITPFKNQLVDFEAFKYLIQRQIQAKIEGIVLLGTTGESPTIEPDERKKLIKTAAKEIQGKASLIVGTGTYSTKDTIKKTEEAKSLGADAVLIIAPYYNCPTQEGLYQHYTAIANSVDIPIIVYNQPKRTGVHITAETLLKIAEHPNIVGCKDSCYEEKHVQMILQNRKKNFSYFACDDNQAYFHYLQGGDGVISVASNLIPEEMLTPSNYQQLHFFFSALALETNPIPIKTAMNLCNLPAGEFRLPLTPISAKNLEKLEDTVKKLNFKTETVYS